MKILLIAIEIANFKGCKTLKVFFDEKITYVKGKNATGKSTIMDAFLWCITGKNSEDSTNFNIKAHDENGNAASGLDHNVTVILDCAGRIIKLSKTYKEKWVKKRGNDESEMDGHTTSYEINDVPMDKKDYDLQIADMLDSELFKILSNPLYFNTMKWNDKRDVLMHLVQSLSDEVPAEIANEVESAGSLENALKAASANKKKMNKEREQIQPRIDELDKQKQEIRIDVKEEDNNNAKTWAEAMITEKQREIETLNFESKEQKYKKALQDLRLKKEEVLNEQKNEHRKKVHDEICTFKNLEIQLEQAKKEYKNLEKINSEMMEVVKVSNGQIEELREQWLKLDREQINENLVAVSNACPTCKHILPEEDILREKNMKLNLYREDKMKRLEEIQAQGHRKAEALNILQFDIKSNCEKLVSEECRIKELQSALAEQMITVEKIKEEVEMKPEAIQKIENEIEAIEKAIALASDETVSEKIQEAKDKIKEYELKRDEAASKAIQFEQLKKLNERIEELKQKAMQLSRSIAESEKIEMMIENYIRKCAEMAQEELNSKFKTIKWRLFESQINGGISQTCTALVDGVPYSDANRAAKINCGIEIISVLSDYYGVSVPIFIDNAECINKILIDNVQQIRMYVTNDEQLVIE